MPEPEGPLRWEILPALSNYHNGSIPRSAWTMPVHPIELSLVRRVLPNVREEVQENILYQYVKEIVGDELLPLVAFFIVDASRADQTRPRTLVLVGPAAARKSTLVSYISMTLATLGERALSKDYLGMPGTPLAGLDAIRLILTPPFCPEAWHLQL